MTTAPQEFTILLVDDRIENLISLEDILEADHRKFIRATSGNEALKTALKTDNIGLIMLDVQMPEMDGFEVAQLLQSNPKTKDISIIFVTAINKDQQFVMRGFEEGAVDYLQKPLDVDVTKAKVNVFEKLYHSRQQLKKTAGDLARINKQLEQFVYIVAHDLKSPLSGIVTMLSVLEHDSTIVKHDRIKSYVDLMSNAANHLASMITSILEYSRQSIEQQAMEDVNVKEMVTQITKLLYPPAHIKIKVDSKLPVMRTRKFKLMQVFQNLISNAIKYNDKPEGMIEVGCLDKGNCYEFYVRDNGQGVSEKDQASLFKLFQTGSNKSNADSSTGVGLNLLKVLVEEQGGQIGVFSEPGNGSRFWFEWMKN